ncbi:sulfated surface glycoprotein 185-like [Zingiber officinale]|uniref:sulfated surface glycoprotein 185-like n=1 Tax=Zingiber officinale TaxID=94328 RepID=UPI001C4CF449|nr:sulfated surface glycoprotein 185-like [Zingiber officinale]
MANRRGPSLKSMLLCLMLMALVHNAIVVAGEDLKCQPSCTTPVLPPPPPPSPPPPSPPLCPPPPAPCPWCHKPPPPTPWCFKCNTPGYLYPVDPDYLLSAAGRIPGARRWAAAGGLLMALAVAF